MWIFSNRLEHIVKRALETRNARRTAARDLAYAPLGSLQLRLIRTIGPSIVLHASMLIAKPAKTNKAGAQPRRNLVTCSLDSKLFDSMRLKAYLISRLLHVLSLIVPVPYRSTRSACPARSLEIADSSPTRCVRQRVCAEAT